MFSQTRRAGIAYRVDLVCIHRENLFFAQKFNDRPAGTSHPAGLDTRTSQDSRASIWCPEAEFDPFSSLGSFLNRNTTHAAKAKTQKIGQRISRNLMYHGVSLSICKNSVLPY